MSLFLPCHSIPLASLEAKNSHTPYLRDWLEAHKHIDNQKMGALYIVQYGWNLEKSWDTSECSQAGQKPGGIRTPAVRRNSTVGLLPMPPAVLFLVINYLSFSLVLNSNSVGQISDVAYPHLHQASSLHKYPRSGPFVSHSLNPSAVLCICWSSSVAAACWLLGPSSNLCSVSTS